MGGTWGVAADHVFVCPSSAWPPIATVSWEKAFQNKFPGHKVDAILGSPPGLQSKQRRLEASSEDPSHGNRAGPIRMDRSRGLARHQVVVVGKTNLADLGRSWSISAAWPIPSRLRQGSCQSRGAQSQRHRHGPGTRELFCIPDCVLPGIERPRSLVPVSALARKKHTSLLVFRNVRVYASQRPSQFLAHTQDSIIAQNGFGSVTV